MSKLFKIFGADVPGQLSRVGSGPREQSSNGRQPEQSSVEIIVENHHRQHDVPCSSSFIIIVDPISTFPKKSSSRWQDGDLAPPNLSLLLSSFYVHLSLLSWGLLRVNLWKFNLFKNYWQIIMTTNTSSQSTACTVQFGKALAMAMLEKENLFLQILDTPLSAGNL